LITVLSPARAFRLAAREASHTGNTRLAAPGYVQANLAILPQKYAADFLLFCQRNARACPLLAVSDAGDYALPALGEDIDLRSDVPLYRVWRRGEVTEECTDIGKYWREDLVTFAIGCSFSFEQALREAGLPLPAGNVPMYRTGIPTSGAGIFHGELVVSMRYFTAAEAIRAIQITSRFPAVHGAPVHLGDPAAIGISDLSRPDYGEAAPPRKNTIPVFWACGVTPQAVAAAAKPELMLTHAPGCLLVTDLLNAGLAAL
jgi:uncharacterized protein YcsI (UPF0317 family)